MITDYARLLYAICKGKIEISANDHRDVYETVEERLKHIAKFDPAAVAAITPEVRAEMIATNTLICVDIAPEKPEEEFSFLGASLEKVLEAAYIVAVELRGKGCVAWPADSINLTAVFGELIATAKCSVSLTINEFKAKHWDIEKQDYVFDMNAKEYLRDLEITCPDRFQSDEEDEAEIGPGLGQQMVDRNEVLSLAFYPNTPVGFYNFMHVDLEGMITGALELCKREVLTMEEIQ